LILIAVIESVAGIMNQMPFSCPRRIPNRCCQSAPPGGSTFSSTRLLLSGHEEYFYGVYLLVDQNYQTPQAWWHEGIDC
jgi:hypothetical protein